MADQKTTWEYSANDRLSAVLDKIDAKFSKVEGATQRAEGKMNRFFSGFAGGAFAINNATQIIERVAQVIEATAGKALTLANNFEQTAISFQTITGSAAAGDALLGQLKELADTTLLANDATYKAGTTLLQFGVDQAAVLPLMRMFGDISGGNSERLQSLALVFGQVSSAGRLMGQDLLQFINLGFNPLQQISQETGISMGELKERMEDGAISVDMVEQAFVRATSEGGIFFQMMDKQSETTTGKISQFQSNFNNKLTEMGQAMQPFVNTLVDFGNAVINNWGTISEVFSTVAISLGAMGAAWLVLNARMLASQGIYAIVTAAQWALNIALNANPIGIIITLIGGLVAGFVVAYNHSEKFRASLAGVWSVIKVVGDMIIGLGQIMIGMSEGWTRFGDAASQVATKGISGIYNEGYNASMAGNSQGAGGSWATPENTPTTTTPTNTAFTTLGKDVKGVSAGGKSVRNVNVTINKLVENLEVHATTINEGIKNAASLVKEEFIRATRDAEIALSANGD